MKKRCLMLALAGLWWLAAAAQGLNYVPGEGGFVCENGNNRFTRALYGAHTGYRLETSDRPVFALFLNSRQSRHVGFRLTNGNTGVALDSTDYCRAVYADGERRYLLRHKGWNGALRMTAWCLTDRDGALWEIQPDGDMGNASLCVSLSGIRAARLNRNGDIGVDADDCFESNGQMVQQLTLDLCANGKAYVLADSLTLTILDEKDGAQLAQQVRQTNRQLTTRIVFDTPDAYLNPLGAALTLAADGAWDGETWLHGAVGWRTQLAGWRAAYAGDVLGWNDRARSHFDAYARSMVTQVEPTVAHPAQDTTMNLARAEKRWGTQMYSNGYICRKPGRNDEMNHYDMNLNYVDELLWHFQYDADTARLSAFWPLLKRHLAWEKRNFDPDDDGLYDAYCCIWASDALYYSGGAVTHSSAYNYRAHRLAAKIARLLGEDPTPYETEARKTLNALNRTLWLDRQGHWAECRDLMGRQRTHESAAVWTIYTPIDCGACTSEQAWQATRYIETQIPHIIIGGDPRQQVVSTSSWMPYMWSINNVATAEVMHTALACFEAGRSDEAFRLLKGIVMDQMYMGRSPGNFGQISQQDAARGECYRDFADCTGIASRTLVQGLFGIVPQALDGQCLLRPGFPSEWDRASIKTPYLSYTFHREDSVDVYEVHQRFSQPLRLVFRQQTGNGSYRDYVGTTDSVQVFRVPVVQKASDDALTETYKAPTLPCLEEPSTTYRSRKTVDLSRWFNASVTDIFRNKYLTPRPPVTTLQIPTQGVGDWCHPQFCPFISDSLFRTRIDSRGEVSVAGVGFRSPAEGNNIVYASLWDNYPDSIVIPLRGRARFAYLLMAGSTNHMQSRIDNAWLTARYEDGTADTLRLVNPDNWCPIEQDYLVDGRAFRAALPRPIRVALNLPLEGRDLGKALGLSGADNRLIPGGAAQLLKMPLNPQKKLRSLTLSVCSNDIVVGLMGLTLER